MEKTLIQKRLGKANKFITGAVAAGYATAAVGAVGLIGSCVAIADKKLDQKDLVNKVGFQEANYENKQKQISDLAYQWEKGKITEKQFKEMSAERNLTQLDIDDYAYAHLNSAEYEQYLDLKTAQEPFYDVIPVGIAFVLAGTAVYLPALAGCAYLDAKTKEQTQQA